MTQEPPFPQKDTLSEAEQAQLRARLRITSPDVVLDDDAIEAYAAIQAKEQRDQHSTEVSIIGAIGYARLTQPKGIPFEDRTPYRKALDHYEHVSADGLPVEDAHRIAAQLQAIPILEIIREWDHAHAIFRASPVEEEDEITPEQAQALTNHDQDVAAQRPRNIADAEAILAAGTTGFAADVATRLLDNAAQEDESLRAAAGLLDRAFPEGIDDF